MRAPWLALLALLLWPGAGAARVVRLEIVQRADYGSFAGAAFERIEGFVHGELDPAEPIPGLAKVARTPSGRVGYRTKLWLIAARDPARDRGTLLIDVINRGRAISHGLYNSSRELDALGRGNGFLQRQGFAVAAI